MVDDALVAGLELDAVDPLVTVFGGREDEAAVVVGVLGRRGVGRRWLEKAVGGSELPLGNGFGLWKQLGRSWVAQRGTGALPRLEKSNLPVGKRFLVVEFSV